MFSVDILCVGARRGRPFVALGENPQKCVATLIHTVLLEARGRGYLVFWKKLIIHISSHIARWWW